MNRKTEEDRENTDMNEGEGKELDAREREREGMRDTVDRSQTRHPSRTRSTSRELNSQGYPNTEQKKT